MYTYKYIFTHTNIYNTYDNMYTHTIHTCLSSDFCVDVFAVGHGFIASILTFHYTHLHVETLANGYIHTLKHTNNICTHTHAHTPTHIIHI